MKPNFFIVGAQRSGTTALSEYLRSHPDVCFSKPKEPHYFADDLPLVQRVKTLDQYLSLFSACAKNAKAIGEGSTAYLQSNTALKNIHNFCPSAKIIVMLRNPVDLVYSLHQHLVYINKENILDFESAWRFQEERKKGKFLPRDKSHLFCLQYSEVGRLGSQINNLFQIFPINQIKIFLFDDFVSNTKSIYSNTISFLNLEYKERALFEKHNYNREKRFNAIRILSNYINNNSLLHKCIVKYKNFGGFNTGLGRIYYNITTNITNRNNLRSEFKNELIETFRNEINLLSKLINRDLSRWLQL